MADTPGRLVLVEDGRRPTALDHVGPDMLAVRWPEWRRRAAHRGAPIKAVLLDQGVAAGLGNIYVNEALWQAGVHPLRAANSLSAAEGEALDRAVRSVLRGERPIIRSDGSPRRDYVFVPDIVDAYLTPVLHRFVDRIEAGTFMVAAAITAGDVVITNAVPEHLEAVDAFLSKRKPDFKAARAKAKA